LGTNPTILGVALFEAPVELPVRAPSEPRWGAGAVVFGSSAGLGYGAALAAPPLRVLGAQLELTFAGGWGAGGPQGAVLVLGRL
jgi:hypothetical protein